ncbi:MAG: iron ABC transporter permease [Planctomycetes bacterium]|nr:iron ABC transporter permease [Planctomycetota bacterium]
MTSYKSSLPEPRSPNAARGPAGAGLDRLCCCYLLALVVVLFGASFLGSYRLTPAAVWDAFWQPDGGRAYADWFDLRFRRLFFAGAVGGILGLCGTVFQALLRNPLAEPYILGISGAASLGSMAVRFLLPAGSALFAEGWLTIGPLAGALAGTALLLAVARWGGLYDPPSLILAGAVLTAIFGALGLLFYTLAPERQVVATLLWLMGNINAEAMVGTPHLRNLLLLLAAGGVGFFAFARHLDLLSLGEEEAADLGVSPRALRVALLIAASLLTGAVVAAAGPIGFAGLVVPHIVRTLHGPGHDRLVPLSILGGAIFLMLCDTAARTCFAPHQLPIGVVTALVGGPFFLFLLGTRRRGALSVA